jgi:NTP pyrophosphatase (non-canonical NTP hydrolase)
MKIDYSDFVKKLAKDGEVIAQELTGNDAHILHMAIGVSGEAGELLDAIKRPTIYRKDIDLENVIEELGDLEFYMEGLRQGLNITREETIEANKKKLSKRYSSLTYSDSQANARADKE